MRKMQMGALAALAMMVVAMACAGGNVVPEQPVVEVGETCEHGLEVEQIGDPVVTAHPGETVVAVGLRLAANTDLTATDLVFAGHPILFASVTVADAAGNVLGSSFNDGDDLFRVPVYLDLVEGERPIVWVSVAIPEKGVGYAPTLLKLARGRAQRVVNGVVEPVCVQLDGSIGTFVDIKRPEPTLEPAPASVGYWVELDASSPIRRKIERGEVVHAMTFKVCAGDPGVDLNYVTFNAPAFDRLWINEPNGQLVGSTIGSKDPSRISIIGLSYDIPANSCVALQLTGIVREGAVAGPTTVALAATHASSLSDGSFMHPNPNVAQPVSEFDVVEGELEPTPSPNPSLPAACGAPSHPKAVIELVGPLQVETYLIPSQDVLSQRMVVTACGSPVGLTKYGTTMSAVFSRATSAWEGFFGPEGEERLAGLRLTGVNVPVDTTISYQPGATDSALSLTWHFLSRILLQPGNRAEFMVRMNVVGGPESSPASIEACYQMNLGSFEVLDLNTAEAATALWAGSGTPMQTCFVTP